MPVEKLKVSKGILIIEGVEWFLYCRRYPKNEALFKNVDDEILIINDKILNFELRDIQTKSFKNLQNQRKKNEN